MLKVNQLQQFLNKFIFTNYHSVMRRGSRTGPTLHKKVQFESIFDEAVQNLSNIWQPIDIGNPPEAQLTILQGKLLLKIEQDEWESYLFELQPERMFRLTDQIDCCHLRCCFLKKFNHFDPQNPNSKYGFRLQFGQNLAFFVTESADQFKKWFMMLKRFCILEKFQRKYKVLAQIKYNDPIFQQVCFNCVRLSDGQYFIVKIISKDMTPQQKQILFKDLMHIRRLNHPQLLRLIEVYEDEGHVYELFDPYIGGDLKQHLRELQIMQDATHQFEEKMLADLMYGLLGALSHMHLKGVFHRDIKLENLLVPEGRNLPFALLSNFCYSENFRLGGGANHGGYKKCGTPGFVAPEIFRTKNYDQKVDVFSLGVVFYILVFGKSPFDGSEQEEVLKQNEKCDIDFRAEKRFCQSMSKSAMDLMMKMLQKDPCYRYTSSQCLNHPWFINMKSKDDQKPRHQISKQKSLSTIVEKSEIMEQTYIAQNRDLLQLQLPSKKSIFLTNNYLSVTRSMRNVVKQESVVDELEREFTAETLDSKISYLNQVVFIKVPSKKRHQSLLN